MSAAHPLRARRRYEGVHQWWECPPDGFPAETPEVRSGDALVAHDVAAAHFGAPPSLHMAAHWVPGSLKIVCTRQDRDRDF